MKHIARNRDETNYIFNKTPLPTFASISVQEKVDGYIFGSLWYYSNCVYGYIPSILCSIARASVAYLVYTSIWLEFRKFRFKSWLACIPFFTSCSAGYVSTNLLSATISELGILAAATLHMLSKPPQDPTAWKHFSFQQKVTGSIHAQLMFRCCI